MMRPFCVVLLLSLLCGLTGCPSEQPTLPQTTSGGGFIIQTQYNTGPAPLTSTKWVWKEDLQGAQGDPSNFTSFTNGQGLDYSNDGRVSALWTVTWSYSNYVPAQGQCIGLTSVISVPTSGSLVYADCLSTGSIGGGADETFAFNPNPVNTATPPTSVTLEGPGFDPTYGMPVIQYFDMSGNLVSQQAAASISPDRTTLTFTAPNFTELTDGTYAGVFSNVAADGSYQYVGTVAVSLPAPFYRPTTYSDMGTNDPNDGWTRTYTPGGPVSGGPLGSYTTQVSAYDDWEIDQNGNMNDVASANGQCTWSGFPSHVDANPLTLYIPISTAVGGPPPNTGFYTVTVTIGGNTTTLYSADHPATYSGVLTATIPAGTNLSTIQVTVSVSPENQNPGGSTGIMSDTISLDIYVQ